MLWPVQFMFCIYGFQNKSSSSKLRATVSLENIVGNIYCEDNMKMTSPFRLDTDIDIDIDIDIDR